MEIFNAITGIVRSKETNALSLPFEIVDAKVLFRRWLVIYSHTLDFPILKS